MYTFILVIHVIVCLILIGVVLLQAGKGAEMGAAFGGSSQTIFGSRGAATFLSKLTVGAAIIFMVTSLSLSMLKGGGGMGSSVVGDMESGTPSGSSEIPTPVETPEDAASE
ncbi:MAG: preprotein translocase subunit SecG [Nitrospiria bacterium]